MIMKIKKTALILFSLSANIALAGSMGMGEAPDRYDGIYLGADIGVSNLLDKETHLIDPETHHLGSLGIVGGGFIGYDYSIAEQIKLGIEGFINANGLNASIHHYDTGTNYSVNARYNGGIRLLPGYEFNPGTIGHLILGYSNARFNVQDNGTYGYINNTFNQSGFQSGLGWKTNLFQRLAVRLDALYTTYANKSSTGIGLTGASSPYQYYINDFSTLEANLSLIYKFG